MIKLLIFRCGYPCAHVLRITNELTLDMIKVQHWKIYASHYNDEVLGIGAEIKKIQFDYINYEGMGVPIQLDVLERSRKPSNDDLYPYFYDRRTSISLLNIQTTNVDYEFALQIERGGCCVTTIDYAQHQTCTVQVSIKLKTQLILCI